MLNLGMNALCGGAYLKCLKQLRNDENFLNGFSADAVPDPTTAGDFSAASGMLMLPSRWMPSIASGAMCG